MQSFHIVTLATLAVGFASIWAIFDNNALADAQKSSVIATETQQAIFAGGCFWCMEKPFEQLDGVHAVESGYSGGTSANPTYQDYSAGGHIEVVRVVYDPKVISYGKLLDTYWRQVDPTDAGGQFVDRGHG